MRAVTIMPRTSGGEAAEAYLRLAISCGLVSAGRQMLFPGRAGAAAARSPLLLPEEWRGRGDLSDADYYGDCIETLGANSAGRENGWEWLIVANARFAVQLESHTIGNTLRLSASGVVAMRASREQCAYREKLTVTGNGKVLGFRRLYQNTIAPRTLAAEWPHLLVVRRGVIDSIFKGGRLPADYRDFTQACAAGGAPVAPFAVPGRWWDLATEAGIVSFFARVAETHAVRDPSDANARISSRARIEGNVVIEDGARVEAGATIIGPAFLGRGARVGKGALVRGAVLAPGAFVPAEGVARNCALLRNGAAKGASCEGVSASYEEYQEAAQPYRTWPIFSYPRIGKRMVDIIGSAIALVGLALIIPLAGLAIKLNSRGSIFFGHKRQGRLGKLFRCWKFRTMVADADRTQEVLRAINKVDGPQFKLENDPRVTLVGAFLRATNLDEVPQFINVLLGQMSIVGPRPSPEKENQMCPQWREARLSVRPGITGYWQVSRSEARTNDFQEWIYYDVEYVRKISFWLDLKIMSKTVWILLREVGRFFLSKMRSGNAADGAEVVSQYVGGER